MTAEEDPLRNLQEKGLYPLIDRLHISERTVPHGDLPPKEISFQYRTP